MQKFILATQPLRKQDKYMTTYKPLARQEAIELMFANFNFTPKTETINVKDALNRMLAKDIQAVHSLPVYRVAAMDGIAVKFSTFASGIMPNTTVWEVGRDYVFADTGDDFPDDFDTVIKIENVELLASGGISLDGIPEEGQNVKPAASTIKSGEILVKAHTELSPRHLAVLLAGGAETIEVFCKPRVGFIPTGSELVPVGSRPQRGQNIETNSFMVSCYLKEWCAEPIIFPSLADSKNQIENLLQAALKACDIVLINAGSSKGQEDYSLRVLESTGKVFAHGLKNAPGRPTTLAVVKGKPVICVPGPPMATDCCMRKTVRYFIYHWYGINKPVRATVRATLRGDISSSPEMEIFTRVIIKKDGDHYTAKSAPMGKNMVQVLSMSNGLLTMPIGVGTYQKGDEVDIEID